MELNQTIKLTIRDLGNNSEGVGSYEGCTIFVEGALPGEEVEATIYQLKKNYGRARLKAILKASPDRVEPACPLYDKCGGCQVMHLSYEKQLEIKQKKVQEALTRIGKIIDVVVPNCLASPLPFHYRNKIQLPVRMKDNEKAIGLYARSSHDLIEIDHCLIHCALGEEIYQEVRQVIKQSSLSVFNPITGQGELRHILIKSAVHVQEVLVILVTNGDASTELKRVAQEIQTNCPKVKGVVQNINTRLDNVILGKYYQTLSGQAFIFEKIKELKFKISHASFFQVNTHQAESLYNKALEFANLQGTEVVLDAYCGVGTLSLLFAKYAQEVRGVECVKEAIEDAKENAQINGITNVRFYCDNAEDFIQKQSAVDLILLNPPRQGCHPSFLAKVGKLLPKTVIYISCDPATLARDLKILYTYNYKIKAIQPYDMFPQTAHVECVVKLQRI